MAKLIYKIDYAGLYWKLTDNVLPNDNYDKAFVVFDDDKYQISFHLEKGGYGFDFDYSNKIDKYWEVKEYVEIYRIRR